MDYIEKLLLSVQSSRSVLCAGIDPVPEYFPPALRSQSLSEHEMVITYCRRVIEQTKTGVAAYKINLAYFEALGTDAYHILNEVLDAIPAGKIIIADAKRGDVPHTNARYKVAYFDRLGFDAITLSPLMGMDTLIPFLHDASRAVYALTLTSNPGAGDLMTRPFEDASTLSEYIARLLRQHASQYPAALGMVVGATQNEMYGPVLKAYPEAPLLIPGIGVQGGSIQELTKTLAGHGGVPLINASRGLSDFDPENNDPWDLQVAANTDRLVKSLSGITERYLEDFNSS